MKSETLTYRRRLELILSMISSWLSEVEGEVREAAGILSGSEGSGQWWAERIRARLLDGSPPDPSIAQSDDQPTTLIEIAFWSGWLRGELETLRRCNTTLETVVTSQGRQLTLPVTQQAVRPLGGTASTYSRLKLSAERLVEGIDAHNSLPGAELVSIHLCDVLEATADTNARSMEEECFTALNEHITDNSVNSLVRLAFDSGILAGLMIRERQVGDISDSPDSKGGNNGRIQ